MIGRWVFGVVLLASAASSQCIFEDTNLDQGVITGDVVCDVDTTVDYLVVFHSDDNTFSEADKNLGAAKMTGGANVTVFLESISVTAGQYLLAAKYNTTDGRNSFISVEAIQIEDVFRDDAPLPPTLPGSFVDTNGDQTSISGTIKFTSPNDSSAAFFEIYLGQGTGRNAQRIFDQEVTSNGVLLEHTTSIITAALYSSSKAFSHVWIYSKTAPRIVNGVDVGSVMSETALHLRVTDRDDARYVIASIEDNTGICSVSAGGTCTCDATYGLCFSFNQDGTISLAWRTANLAQQRYSDNTFIDVSSTLHYDVGLGHTISDVAQNCSWQNQTFGWPSGSPSSGFSVSSIGEVTTFTLTGQFSQLEACGFLRSSDPTIFAASGVISLYVWSSSATTTPSLTIHQYLSLRFKETIYDVVEATIQNIEIINPKRAGLGAEIQVLSTINFFEMGFLSQKSSLVYGSNGDSEMFVEHTLISNQDHFYLVLERVWFTRTESTFNEVEYELESTNQAFTNYDNPPHLGRYRFSMDVPFVMNCRPCFMHVSSRLAATQPTTKSLSDTSATHPTKRFHKSTTSTRAIIIESTSDSSPASVVAPSIGSLAVALVASRW